MAEDLQIDLRLGRQRQHRPRLPGNLAQLGAVGPLLFRGNSTPAPGTQPLVMPGHIVSGAKQQTMGHAQKPVMHYLSEGKGRDGQDALLFGNGATPLDPTRFANAIQTDSRQFRFSVSLPAHIQYVPLQAYAEVLMARIEKDLGRPLDWVGAVHHDTKHPHVHVVLRGKDLAGKDLLINKHYLSHGMKHRARQVAAWLVGDDRLYGRGMARTHEPAQQQTVRRSLGHPREQQRGQELGV